MRKVLFIVSTLILAIGLNMALGAVMDKWPKAAAPLALLFGGMFFGDMTCKIMRAIDETFDHKRIKRELECVSAHLAAMQQQQRQGQPPSNLRAVPINSGANQIQRFQ